MKLCSLVCVASVALVVFTSFAEARSSRYYGRHHSRRYYDEDEDSPATRQIQQEEPKPIEIEPTQSKEVSEEASVEKARPARARKVPVLCNANAEAANLGKPDKVETTSDSSSGADDNDDDSDSWEVIEPLSAESAEVEPPQSGKSSLPTAAKAKKLDKPSGKVVPASEESSESVEEDEEETKDDDEDDDSKNNFSAALASLEEPAPPKALTTDEIPMEQTPAVENQEEEVRPKARRAKHHRSDVRRIRERPHRRRVIFRDDDE